MKKNTIPCYYLYMKYIPNHKETLKKILPPIQNVWEVKIKGDVWEKIQMLAQTKKVTYSWIVRFCVFTAITMAPNQVSGVENPTVSHLMTQDNSGTKNTKSIKGPKKKSHRHKLCLYGEDEKLLRISAMELGITVSAFIRICLDQFLETVEDAEYADLFSRGIKLGKEYRLYKHLRHQPCRKAEGCRWGFPHLMIHRVVKFSKSEWWKVPSGAQIPLSIRVI